jgi:hypothetical protein
MKTASLPTMYAERDRLRTGLLYRFVAHFVCDRCHKHGTRHMRLIVKKKGGIRPDLAAAAMNNHICVYMKSGWFRDRGGLYVVKGNAAACNCKSDDLLRVVRFSLR